MEDSEARRIIEAVILGSPEPISAQRVAAVIPYCKPARVQKLVLELNAEYIKQGRSFEIDEIAGGYQVRTLPEFASYLQQTQPQRPLRLSKPALETLAIVAYRQPVTRAEIEHVRGVDVGAVIRSLLERKLVRMHGHKEVAGRPMLYGTSARFLEVFGLETLNDLPSLREIAELLPAGAAASAEEDGVEAGDSGDAADSPDAEFTTDPDFDASPDSPAAFADSEPFSDSEPVWKQPIGKQPIGKPH